jgi:hypothetical protein
MKLLFVTALGDLTRQPYRVTWRSNVKLLLASKISSTSRAVSAIASYVRTGRRLGHEVAVLGEQTTEAPELPRSLNVKSFDFVVFVVFMAGDFPDLPYLAQLLDGVPRGRRLVIDCCGRYNDTIRVEHDFNHLELVDGHQGWEWVEGFKAVADKIVQPTLKPRRSDVAPFLFYGFDRDSIVHDYATGASASTAWAGNGNRGGKRYGISYVGTNWQRWTQVRRLLASVGPAREQIGRIRLTGWDWASRPKWAEDLSLRGVDVDPQLLADYGVETEPAVPYTRVVERMSEACFCPVFHRPLFNELGLVTNRTFETLCADSIPLLFLSESFVEEIYGPEARLLRVTEDPASHIDAVKRNPARYWDAVLKTRRFLHDNHSYERRFAELVSHLTS